MAPLRSNAPELSHLCELGVYAISVLFLCITLCILLVVTRLPNRISMPHITQLDPFHVEKKAVESIFDAQDPIDAVDRQLLMELLSPLLGTGPRKSALLTSGYLAAKAKMETTRNLPDVVRAEEHLDLLHAQRKDSKAPDIIEHQKLQWSRRSSPGPFPVSSSETGPAPDVDEMDLLTRFSSLRGELKHHQLQNFCDDHNPRVKWRRRTLVFEKTP